MAEVISILFLLFVIGTFIYEKREQKLITQECSKITNKNDCTNPCFWLGNKCTLQASISDDVISKVEVKYARISVVLSSIGFLIFATLFILAGVLGFKSNYTHSVMGQIVQKKNCDQEGKQCRVDIEYKVNGENYNLNGVYVREEIKSDELSIYYDPKNPSDATIQQPANKIFGGVLILIGVIIALFTLSNIMVAFSSNDGARYTVLGSWYRRPLFKWY